MSSPDAQPALETSSRHLLLYDGVCGLCDRLVQFVLAHDREGLFHFAALQSAAGETHLARFGARASDLDTVSVIPYYRDERAHRLTKGRAVLYVVSKLGWPWRLAGLLAVLPSPLLDAAYDVVARYRYRLFGKYDTCRLIQPEQATRFLGAHTTVRGASNEPASRSGTFPAL